MKKLVFAFLLTLLATSGVQAQLNDSLVACRRNISLLVIKTDQANFFNPENTDVKVSFYSGFNAFRAHDNNRSSTTGLFNTKYQRLELKDELSMSLPALRYYRIVYNKVVVYVGSDQLNDFIAAVLKKPKDISLTRIFSSVAYHRFAADYKKDQDNVDNNCCFQDLVVTAKPDIQAAVALKNILLQVPNTGKITKVTGNSITLSPVGKADFMEDVDYYILGKPDLRVKITNASGSNFSALVYDRNEGNASGLTAKDVVTNLIQ